LIEEDFLTLTDLRRVLFGKTYSSRYAPPFKTMGHSLGCTHCCFGIVYKGKMSMTTYYLVPELTKMLEYSNRVCKRGDKLILLKRRGG